jgi:hypothetical protein
MIHAMERALRVLAILSLLSGGKVMLSIKKQTNHLGNDEKKKQIYDFCRVRRGFITIEKKKKHFEPAALRSNTRGRICAVDQHR